MQESSGAARARPVRVVPAADPKGAYDAAAQRGIVGILPAASRLLLAEWAEKLGAGVAALSSGDNGWRFEGESHPQNASTRPRSKGATDRDAWAGIVVGTIAGREWLLILPGTTDRWRNAPGLETFIAQFRATLENRPRPAEDPRFVTARRRLYAFTRRIASRSGQDAHAYILRTIAPVISARMGSFALYDDSDGTLTITATYGYPSAVVDHVRIVPGAGVVGQVFSTGRAIVGRAGQEGRRRLRYVTDSFVAVPLIAAGRRFGVISFADKTDASAFDRRDLSLVRMFAAPAALAVAREGVMETLESVSRAAVVDPVTGLFNRRHLESVLHTEVDRARRQQQALSLLMIDVDDFKRVNDMYGHLEGDRLLATIAEALRGTVRTFDFCARYGGEEFAIIMPGASLKTAAHVADRVRRSVETRSTQARLPVTVSVGAALLLPDDSPEDLVAAADRALMAAKRAGKNDVRTDPGRLS